jgi:hypothetical protein
MFIEISRVLVDPDEREIVIRDLCVHLPGLINVSPWQEDDCNRMVCRVRYCSLFAPWFEDQFSRSNLKYLNRADKVCDFLARNLREIACTRRFTDDARIYIDSLSTTLQGKVRTPINSRIAKRRNRKEVAQQEENPEENRKDPLGEELQRVQALLRFFTSDMEKLMAEQAALYQKESGEGTVLSELQKELEEAKVIETPTV